jgi:hypothetical protein
MKQYTSFCWICIVALLASVTLRAPAARAEDAQ